MISSVIPSTKNSCSGSPLIFAKGNTAIAGGLLSETIFSDEAITIALENNLTILGTSDIHGIADWKFKIPEGGHRPITFVLSEKNESKHIKKALFEGKTIVWFKDLMIGTNAKSLIFNPKC